MEESIKIRKFLTAIALSLTLVVWAKYGAQLFDMQLAKTSEELYRTGLTISIPTEHLICLDSPVCKADDYSGNDGSPSSVIKYNYSDVQFTASPSAPPDYEIINT